MPQQQRSPTVKLIFTILLLAVSVPFVHIFFVLHVWEDGVDTLNSTLHQEIDLLNLDENPTALNFVNEMVHDAYDLIYKTSGLEAAASDTGSIADMIVKNWNIVQGLMLSAQLVALRLAVVILSIPFFMLVMLIAISDGVYAWMLRRTSGDRESAFIYHRTKRGFMAGIIGMIFIYLIPPVVMDPKYVLPPFILLSALAVRMTIKYFKKYI